MENKIYEILKNHQLPLSKREAILEDLMMLFDAHLESAFTLYKQVVELKAKVRELEAVIDRQNCI